MLTAMAVLLLSAVGGGIVGALLTSTYPADSICDDCEAKAKYQEQILYERSLEKYPQEEYPSDESSYDYQGGDSEDGDIDSENLENSENVEEYQNQ